MLATLVLLVPLVCARDAANQASASLSSYSPLSSTSTLSSTSIGIISSASTAATSTSISGSASLTTSRTASSPASSSTNQKIEVLIDSIRQRRIETFIGSIPDLYIDNVHPKNIDAWLTTIDEDGKWPSSEVDYTTGCDARRANWPAQRHWERLLVMAAAWHGGFSDADPKFVQDDNLRSAISTAMNFWFTNDYTNSACLSLGGQSACPCGTPGLWNTNWFSNTILIPKLLGRTCLFLFESLSTNELNKCIAYTARAYTAISTQTGANTLDVAGIGIDSGLLSVNTTIVSDAYSHVHSEVVIQNKVKSDGIRGDGSFAQHSGVLYSGNYGKDYTNAAVDLEITAVGTEFAAGSSSRDALAALLDGDRWMIYRDISTGVLHWDLSVLNRFISFPEADDQATGRIHLNLTEIGQLGNAWQSYTLTNFSSALLANTSGVNAGMTFGNRLFYNSDYMTHRSLNYITTVKMFSTRTLNSECVNSQNPLGFHLSDFATFTYLTGGEYKDIAGAWDWDLIPGTTVDYRGTPLNCDTSSRSGLETFVGGISDGENGLAAMKYTNPNTKAFGWNKVQFFLSDDVQLVMVTNVSSASRSPVYTILDQKRFSGNIVVNGRGTNGSKSTMNTPRSLWHDNIGYLFPTLGDLDNTFKLLVDVNTKTTNWSSIGTSTQPDTQVDLFTAKIEHTSLDVPLAYYVFPGVDAPTFAAKKQNDNIKVLQNNRNVSAVYDHTLQKIMAVFWGADGGTMTAPFPWGSVDGNLTIVSSGNAALIYDMNTGAAIASDPSQTLTVLNVRVTWGDGVDDSKTMLFDLPTGGSAGDSISPTSQLLFIHGEERNYAMRLHVAVLPAAASLLIWFWLVL